MPSSFNVESADGYEQLMGRWSRRLAPGLIAAGAPATAQELAQERLLGAVEQGHVGAVLPAAQDRAEGDQEDLQEQVALGVAGTRVLQLGENLGEPLHGTAPSRPTMPPGKDRLRLGRKRLPQVR